LNEKDFEKLVFGMAHQIRNPCAIIRSNADLLLKNCSGRPEMQRSLEAIINGARYLEARLDEFVEFSKPLPLSLRPLPVKQLLDDVVTMMKEKCHLQKTSISAATDAALTLPAADHDQLLMAFLNVVLNSIEAAREGGSIRLSGKKHEQGILITVQDDGCGIHPRDLPEIFSPFYSTKNQAGIGLAITKRIFDAHKASIQVVSEQKKGTIVLMTFPEGHK
jgi:signal transduction histidine kinase